MARAYDSSARVQAVRETRHRILAVATELIIKDGYGAMTIATLARAAGVSPQTVYNAIGGKAEVVKAAYDVLLAGDEGPLPMRERPEFRAVVESADPVSFGAAYAAWTRRIYDRVGAFLSALLVPGAAGDPALEKFMSTIDRERRAGNEMSIPAPIRDSLADDLSRAVDIVWTLSAPEVHDRLCRRAGWTPDAYERWLAEQLERAVVAPARRGGSAS